MVEGQVVIPKVWRSEMPHLVAFFALCIGSVIGSHIFPNTVISGKLITLGTTTYYMDLPTLWLAPAAALISLLLRIYNVRYIIDQRGAEAHVGILSVRHRIITRVRYEDIRSIDSFQTLWERFLDVGRVDVGTASTAGIEISFEGISNPRRVQQIIQEERDARLEAAERQAEAGRSKAETANGAPAATGT